MIIKLIIMPTRVPNGKINICSGHLKKIDCITVMVINIIHSLTKMVNHYRWIFSIASI